MSSDTLHACEVTGLNQQRGSKGKYAYLLPTMAEIGINTGSLFSKQSSVFVPVLESGLGKPKDCGIHEVQGTGLHWDVSGLMW